MVSIGGSNLFTVNLNSSSLFYSSSMSTWVLFILTSAPMPQRSLSVLSSGLLKRPL